MYLRQSERTHVLSRTKGYLTVFLSMSIMIIMSLILVLVHWVRIGAVKLKTEAVADIAMNSTLAEYNRELFDQYGLMMVDTSYGGTSPTIVNTQEHLRYYAQKNFDRTAGAVLSGGDTILSMRCDEVNITGSSFAMDNDAAVLKRQILAYMGAEPIEGMLTDVYDNAQAITGSGLDTTDVEEMARQNQEAIDAIELPTVTNAEGEEEEVALGNPADPVNAQKGIGALPLAVKDLSRISNAAVDVGQYASHRQLNKGTGLMDNVDISVAENALLEQYYYEKCSRYGAELDKSALKYQLEYLIYGEGSDYANLNKMATDLLFIREAANMMYLFSCGEKVAQAEALAAVLTAVLMVPELLELVKFSILFAWVFAESVSDLNILFSGGRVPIFKTDSTWRLSLTSMLLFRDFLGGGDLGEGLYYQDYARARLLLADPSDKIHRMADLMEMDIRNTAGNSSFKIDHCLDAFCAEIHVSTAFGYDCKIERIYGYER